ncbi:glycosyltransferase family 4 protein [Cupriavidus sp. BIS7]|uniref:glycosyltransferase family 4 protein n=1 Tax=Cupriavidus sp. BIS7 TaxID=1217718 RepID=UPI0003761159|nr:glycosyltransferase family 4 protein [Cupriavidus sp. BIS7]
MKIAALTSGLNVPSARFRVRQYLPALRRGGLDVTEYCPRISQAARLPGKLGQVRVRYFPPLLVGQAVTNFVCRIPGIVGSFRADVTWLERNFVPGLDDLSRIVHTPLVLDIDDAIWLYNPLGAKTVGRLVSRAEMVLAGNQYLADWCSQFCENIRIIPTAIDTERFRPREQVKRDGAPFVVGWTGTSGNFRFLEMIEPALSAFFRDVPTARFLVVADKRPHLPALPQDRIDFVPWSASAEHLLVQDMDVGLMPIDDTDLSRGKCSFKMLQYMAAGVPVVASPFGMNGEVFAAGDIGYAANTNADWIDALHRCQRDRELRIRQGQNGRGIIVSRFSTEVVANAIRDSFCSMQSARSSAP